MLQLSLIGEEAIEKRKKLGEILVEKGTLTEKTVERMLALSRRLNKRFGTVLEDVGLIDGEELAAALATQYSCRVVSNFAGYSYSPELLATISVDVAMQNNLFPLKLDNKRLALAMADPTETRVVRNIAANNDLTITPFIATRKEIYAAICRNYLQKEISVSSAQTVLVVDDDKMMSTMFGDFLSKKGYRVILAADGLEAYKAGLTEAAGDPDGPDDAQAGRIRALRRAARGPGVEPHPGHPDHEFSQGRGRGEGVRARFFRFHRKAGQGRNPAHEGEEGSAVSRQEIPAHLTWNRRTVDAAHRPSRAFALEVFLCRGIP